MVALLALLAAGAAVAAVYVLAARTTTAHTSHQSHGSGSASEQDLTAPRPAARHEHHRRLGESPADTLPFPPDLTDRAPRPGEIPSLYADGLWCSTACRPYGAQIGWPLLPFHRQHPIRAGLNELRPGSLHVGVDVQARDNALVYAVQPGIARVLAPDGPNARVQVGNYIYWHITPAVQTGESVLAFQTPLGTVMPGYGHLAFSEVNGAGQYVNPLRPGGSVLLPDVDRVPPVIGRPTLARNGQVIAGAYDAQSFVRRTTYVTPVLAPAGLAYRLYRPDGTPVTPLEWAFRGTHLLPWALRSYIYGPGAHAPGFACFAHRRVCVPRWSYRVAGGLAPPLPTTLAPGHYRLTIYAWNWSSVATALDTNVRLTPLGWQTIGHFPKSLLYLPVPLLPAVHSPLPVRPPALSVPNGQSPGVSAPAGGPVSQPPATRPPLSVPSPPSAPPSPSPARAPGGDAGAGSTSGSGASAGSSGAPAGSGGASAGSAGASPG